MCGILVCHKKFGLDFIKAATDIISKRGADFMDSVECDDYIFLHSRLIITGDSNNGSQPFETPDNIFLFNGEIYNYEYLNKLLDKPLTGNISDSQVIHACIIQFGLDIINSFDGPFAIIYYDKHEKKIHAFRDHIGEKPLFYYESEQSKIFASDLKIFKYLQETSIISDSSLSEYLSKGYVPKLNTIFKSVYRVKQWKIQKNKFFINYNRYVDDKYGVSLFSKFTCIGNQISYKNAALLISGGVDSTLVACFMPKTNIQLYTTKFKNEKNDESKIAYSTAMRLKLPITSIELTHEIDEQSFCKLINSLNEPVGDPGIINQFFSLNKIKEDGKRVVFVGTGGDEIFFGYPRYRFLPLKIFLDLIPENILKGLKYILFKIKLDDISKNRIMKFISESSSVFKPEYDLENYLPNQLFSAFDSLSFNNGIEARTPFTSILLLDHSITSKNASLLDIIILKFKLKFILMKYFSINKFFIPKRGFTNDYSNLSVNKELINYTLFDRPNEVKRAANESKLHFFRVLILSRWLKV
jgi:asparagine synthase (glutamine-hydrolysing)